MNERGKNHAGSRLNGFVLEGGGEILVWDAKRLRKLSMAPRPELKPQVDEELTASGGTVARPQPLADPHPRDL